METQQELCLGTVQFGLPYGVTNKRGKVSKSEVEKILMLAAQSGIRLLDTAIAYGESEKVLGYFWPKNSPRKLISKMPSKTQKDKWETSLLKTLEYLKTDKLDAFLLHRAADLLEEGGDDLLRWLESLIDRGLVNRIGISIYDKEELNGLPLNRLHLVQLPLSIYDQRVIHNGTIDKLQDMGIKIHTRSSFLQGLILQSPNDWPSHINSDFKDHHAKWISYLSKNQISPLEYALNFVRSIKGVEASLVGVLSACELEQIVRIWNRSESYLHENNKQWAWPIECDIDPRLWLERSR